MLFGRTPVDEVLASSTRSSPGRGSTDCCSRGGCAPRRPVPRFATGRLRRGPRPARRSKAICRELGIAYGLAEAQAGAPIEMLAGEWCRGTGATGGDRLATEMGAARYVALYRTRPAHVLIAQDERRSGSPSSSRLELSGSSPGVTWKTARARLLARAAPRGAEAAALARDAAASVAGSDDLTPSGQRS